jgi:hypothetical protein
MIPTPAQRFFATEMRGKLGKSSFPDPHAIFGIYQIRHTKKGRKTVKMKFYVPTNPRTTKQQANRQKFAAAMAAWQNLTNEEKEEYNKRARKISRFGWGLFIRNYYQSFN